MRENEDVSKPQDPGTPPGAGPGRDSGAEFQALSRQILYLLARANLEEYERSLTRVCRELGAFWGADCIDVGHYSEDTRLIHVQRTWMDARAGDGASRADSFIEECPELIRHLRNRGPLSFATAEDLSEGRAGIRDYIGALGMRSAVLVPIHMGNDGLDFLAVAAVNAPRAWAPHQIAQIQEIAALLMAVVTYGRRYGHLAQTVAQLRQILDSCPIAMLVTTVGGQILEANPAAVELAGFSSMTELCDANLLALAPTESKASAIQLMERILRQGTIADVPFELQLQDGSIIPTNCSARRLQDDQGHVQGFLVILRDVREQLRTEGILRESEGRLRAIFEASPNAITVTDLQGQITAANQTCAQILGFRDVPAMMAASREVIDWVGPEGREEAAAQMKAAQDAPHPSVFEYPMLRRDGSTFLAEVSLSPIRDARGAPTALIGITRDITDVRQALAALQESERRYRQLFDTVPDGILLLDALSGEIIDANAAALRMYGYSPGELMGQTISLLGTPQSPLPASDAGAPSPEGSAVHLHRRKDGKDFPVEISSDSYRLGSREVICQVVRDVSVQAEGKRRLQRLNVLKEDLLQSAPLEEKLRRVTDELVDQFHADFARVWIIRPGDRCHHGCAHAKAPGGPGVCQPADRCLHLVASSGRYTHLDGASYSRVPLGSHRIGRIASGAEGHFLTNDIAADPDTQDRAWALSLGLRSVAAYRMLAPNGTPIGVLALFGKKTFTSEDDALFAGLAATASQIVWMDEAEDERHRLVTAMEQTGEMIITAGTSLRMEYINPAFFRITGYSSEDVADRYLGDILELDDQGGGTADILQVLDRNRIWTGRVVCLRKDGTRFVADATLSPVRDAQERLISIVVLLRDVSELVEMEAQLRQSQKMEAIGTLAGGIAHDFNNMLYAILGFADLASDDVPPDSIAHDCLSRIRTAGERASHLVKQILAFSHPGKIEHAPISIHTVVREALDFMRGSLPATIELWRHIDSACSPVLADPTQIHQIIMNLCTNAFHAMRDSCGVLTVSLQEVALSEEDAQPILDLSPGQYARLTIQDTGIGMDETVQRRIFEPYFTTKAVGEGTGMGLATVHSIVNSMHGAITVHSKINEGTRFDIFLPVFAAADPRDTAPGDAPQVNSGCERLLLVDDEDAIIRLGLLHLGRLGYAVEGFTDPRAAWEAFEANPHGFDAMITDHAMPHLSGTQLARQVRQLRPDFPIILCTGFSGIILKDPAGLADIDLYLEKPIEMRALSGALRSLLDDAVERGA